MPDYSAGEAKLSIVPDVSGFARKLEADLKRINAEFAIRVAADTGQARADINRFREAAQRDNIKIGVDVGTAEASAELAAWRARQHANNVKIKVDADTGSTLKQIKELQGAVGDIFGTFGRGLKFGITWSGVGELPAVTLALTQAVGAVQQLAQAGLVIPGVFAGIGASIGTLALGLDGVKDAYDAVTKAAQTSGQDAAQHAREVTSATNAHRNAVVDEAQAERDRTRAVKDASQALQDLNLQLRGGKISEQQAINNALRQRRDLQKDLATGQIKDQLDLQQRLLDIESADQSVAEAHQRNIELQDKVSEANEKGIANSDQVVAANERVVRSQQQVEQSAGALAAATANQSAAAKAASEAMDKLSPNAKDFVNTLVGMKNEFSDLQNTVQDNLFAGMSQNLKDLVASDLPNLKAGLGGIATAWNGTLTQLMKSLGSDSSKGLLDRILGDTAEAQRKFTEAIDPLVHGIGVLTAAGADALPRLADDLKSVADRFNGFITAAADNGSLSKWINDGITGFEHIGNTLLNVGDALAAITRAAGGGEGLLGMLERGSKALADFLNSTEGQNQLKTWFEEGRREIQDHIIPLLKALPGIFKGVVDVGKEIADVVVPPLKMISTLLSEHPGLIKDVVYTFAAWKGIQGVTSLITDLGKINDLLGVKGGKGGKGGKGILGKLALVTIAGVALDSLLDDPTQQPSATPGAAPAPPQGQLPAGQLPAGQPVPFGSVPVVPPEGVKDAATGAVTGGVLGGPWGAAAGPLLTAPPGSDATKDDKRTDDEKTVDQIIYTLPQLPDNEVQSLADDLGISTDQLKSMSRDELRKRLLDAIAKDRANPAPPPPPTRTAPANPIPAAPPAGSDAPDDLHGLLGGFAAGGPTPAWAGPLADGGYPAVVHPREFVISERGRASVPDSFLHALNKGAVNPSMLPHFESGGPVDGNFNPGIKLDTSTTSVAIPYDPNRLTVGDILNGSGSLGPLDPYALHKDHWAPGESPWAKRGVGVNRGPAVPAFADGGFVDPYGNPLQPGMLPGPSEDPSAPIAPNPTGGGVGGIFGSVLSGLNGPLSNLSSLIPGSGGQQSGVDGVVRPGLAGLFDAGGDQNKLNAWGQQTGNYLANWGANFLTKFATTLYGGDGSGGGLLGFLGLSNSILSPSNPWFQAGAKSLGILNGFMPGMQGLDGNLQLGSQSITLGDGSTISVPTFGTSVTTPGVGTGGAVAGAPVPDFDAIAQKESGGNWSIPSDNQGRPYRGGLQILDSTWRQFGGEQYAPTANLASKEEQIAVAQRIYAAQGAGAWPNTFTYKSAAVSSSGAGGLSFNPGNFTGLDALAKSQFGLSMTSGFRDPNGPTIAGVAANASYHGQGRAHDYAGSEQEMIAFANFMADNYGSQLKELIFDAPGFGKTIKDGKVVGPFGAFYTLGQAGNHADHVHIAYASGGHTPGSRSTPIPAILHGNEFVQRASAVDKYGVPFMTALNEGRIDPATLPHFINGGPVAGYVKPLPVPPRPQVPDIQRINPPRAAAVIPSAPTKPLPAPVQAPPPPAPVTPPVDQQPAQKQPQYQGPAPVAPAPDDLNHNLAAINTGISSGFSTAGSLAATAISSAAAAGTFGAAGAAGAGSAGSLVAGLFNEAGKIATNLVNVGSSFLVGNVTAGTTPNAYGELNLAPQNAPVTAPDNRRSYVFNGVDGRNIVDDIRLKDAQDMQAQLSTF